MLDQTLSTEEVKEPLKPVNPIFINTPTGTLAVFGHEYVAKEMLKLIGTILSHDAFEIEYHGIKSIVFRTDGYPKENGVSVCATFAPDVCGVAINMEKTLEKAIERSMDHPEMSLLASWWTEMLFNFGHEVHHGVAWNVERKELVNDETKRQEEEEQAEEYSDSLMVTLAQDYDIEPPAIKDEIWFNTQITELLSGKAEDTWAKNQQEMLDNKYLWKHVPEEGEPVILSTFKDLVCLIFNGDIEADEWNKDTIKIPVGVKTLDEQLNGKKITIDSSSDDLPIEQDNPLVQDMPSTQISYNEDDDMGSYDMYQEPITIPIQTPVQTPVQTSVAPIFPSTPLPANIHSSGIQYDGATISRIARQVYMKMYDFIFRNCSPLRDSDVGFANPEAVCSIPVPLTDEEKIIFVSMNHNDINGRWCSDVPTTNGLLGKIMKNTKLPSYELTMNVNGVTHKRLLIPQNPAKRNATGQLTQRAVEARAGNCIAYIMNPDDNTNAKWGPYIVNREYKTPQIQS
ncbi:hypothetical protein KAW18_03995 [candidate division WOR-3 bacterium]|nr:hypothetical protein [candidate division WOR-3 bacterium]